MAKLPAELHGIRELVRAIAAYDAQSNEADQEREDEGERAALAGVVEVDVQVANRGSGMLSAPVPA